MLKNNESECLNLSIAVPPCLLDVCILEFHTRTRVRSFFLQVPLALFPTILRNSFLLYCVLAHASAFLFNDYSPRFNRKKLATRNGHCWKGSFNPAVLGLFITVQVVVKSNKRKDSFNSRRLL